MPGVEVVMTAPGAQELGVQARYKAEPARGTRTSTTRRREPAVVDREVEKNSIWFCMTHLGRPVVDRLE